MSSKAEQLKADIQQKVRVNRPGIAGGSNL